MFKKLTSTLAILAIALGMTPLRLALAADIQDDDLINLIIFFGEDREIDLTTNEVLEMGIDFADNRPELANSSGSLVIQTADQVDVVEIGSWTNEAAPQDDIFTWNGKKGCGDDADPCPNGNYFVIANVSYQQGADTIFDREVSALQISGSHAVVSNLSLSRNEFNPANQTVDIDYNLSENALVSAHVLDSNNVVVRTLLNNQAQNAGNLALSWNGRDGANAQVDNGDYMIRVRARENAVGAILSEKMATVTVNDPTANQDIVQEFTVTASNGGNFDPAPDAGDENLQISYVLSEAPSSVVAEIRDADDDLLKTFNSVDRQRTFTWDGIFANKLVLPGTYHVDLILRKADNTVITQTRNFTVEYPSASRATISSFTVSPNSFDPDVEDTVIEFRNNARADITVEIQNAEGDVLRTFSQFDDDDIPSDTSNRLVWNGENNNANTIGSGDYKVVIVTRNDFGVVRESRDVTVTDDGQSLSKSNSHIDSISCRPSGDFEPGEDEVLECEADTKLDDLSVIVYAVRGNEEIELFDDSSVDKGSNTIEFDWDGTDDDDEYVDEGTWRIEFRTEKDDVALVAGITKDISYETPRIDEFLLSKDEIDNDRDEFTYAMFRLDDDAEVDLFYLVDGDRDDEIIEDLEVEADLWYAVEIDGNGYDYDEDIDIELVAKNRANDDINSTRRTGLDIDEDEVSSTKSNVTRDYLAPVVTTCEDDILEIGYDLEDTADVVISIHRGKTDSGSKVIELASLNEQEGGDHLITWNCRDSNNRQLSEGFYTYKIQSKDRSTDTESGIFIVDNDIGDVDGGGSFTGGGSSNDNGTVNPNVIIVDGGGQDEPQEPSSDERCAGFSDVSEDDFSCDAVTWAKEEGVFKGYADGSFGFNQRINRVELLKVILEATDLSSNTNPAGNLGFVDVEPGAWYMRYINAAQNVGIFQGDAGRNTARPADNVNKVEALKMAFEAVRVANGYVAGSCIENYADVEPGAWYFNYVCEAQRNFLFDDVFASNFVPAKQLTRGEIVEMLFRMHLADLL